MNHSQDILRDLDARRARALYPPYNVRCGIALMNENTGSILVVRERARDDFCGNTLGIPKGMMINADRDFFACACREFREETGIELRDIDCHRADLRFVFHNEHFHDILVVFVVLVKSDIEIDESHVDAREISECFWASPTDLLEADARATDISLPRYIRRLINYLISHNHDQPVDE
jgi:8-oxo-dGTP pyrophosphatase MutT (NUDIX family)